MTKKKFCVILTVATLIACLFLHIDGFFKYEWTHSTGIQTTDILHGTFSHLLINVGAGSVFTLGTTVTLIASIVFVWRGFKNDVSYSKLNIGLCGVSVALVLVGSLLGANTFYRYNSAYAPNLGYTIKTLSEFHSLGIGFYIEILALIALIVLHAYSKRYCISEPVVTVSGAQASFFGSGVTRTATVSDKMDKTASNSVADELVQLKELLNMELITQEEFDAKKKQILGL